MKHDLRANRQVCDIVMREYNTQKPWLLVDFANSTGINLSGDSVHAMAKGRKRISFQNPMDNTMTLEFQCFPFKLMSLFSDGKIRSDAVYTVNFEGALKDGAIEIEVPEGAEVVANSLFVYPKGAFGEEDQVLEATISGNKVTVTTAGATEGEGGSTPAAEVTTVQGVVMVKRDKGVKRIPINDDMLAIDVAMEMKTLNKTEAGTYVPLLIQIYKATIQRNFELTFASEGDPATITMTFDVLDTTDGNIEMVELEDE